MLNALVPVQVGHKCHDDIIKWNNFPRYCTFVPGIYRSPVNSPHKTQWREALLFSLICAWMNSWVINRSWGWWFETPSRSLWRQCIGTGLLDHHGVKICPISFLIKNIPCNLSLNWCVCFHSKTFESFRSPTTKIHQVWYLFNSRKTCHAIHLSFSQHEDKVKEPFSKCFRDGFNSYSSMSNLG